MKQPLEMFEGVTKSATEFWKSLPKNPIELTAFYQKVQKVLEDEAKSTQEMWQIYQKSMTGDATPNEIAKANKKAQELLTSTGFVLLSLAPFSFFFLPILVKSAKDMGIDVVPASIKKEFNL